MLLLQHERRFRTRRSWTDRYPVARTSEDFRCQKHPEPSSTYVVPCSVRQFCVGPGSEPGYPAGFEPAIRRKEKQLDLTSTLPVRIRCERHSNIADPTGSPYVRIRASLPRGHSAYPTLLSGQVHVVYYLSACCELALRIAVAGGPNTTRSYAEISADLDLHSARDSPIADETG